MEEVGRNEDNIFYLDKNLTDWCRHSNKAHGIQAENWHVLRVFGTNDEFKAALIMDSDTNEVIGEIYVNSLEDIACRIDVLKLANKKCPK